MSYQKVRDEFLIKMNDAEVPLETTYMFLRWAVSYGKAAKILDTRDWSQDEIEKDERLQKRISKTADKIGMLVLFGDNNIQLQCDRWNGPAVLVPTRINTKG